MASEPTLNKLTGDLATEGDAAPLVSLFVLESLRPGELSGHVRVRR